MFSSLTWEEDLEMGSKAKLLLFSHVSNTRSITGAEKLLLFLCRKLSVHFNCTLVAPQEGQLTRQARSQGLAVIVRSYPLLHEMYTPAAHLHKEADRLRSSLACQTLAEMIRTESPDYVLTNTCVNILPALAASSLGIPVIWSITEAMVVNEFTPLSVELISRYSQWIIGISEASISAFRGTGAEERISLLFPSWNPESVHQDSWPQIREEKRMELGLHPDDRLVGYISSFLTQEKGLDHFIDMALMICSTHRNARFLVIGRIINKDYYALCLSKVNASEYRTRFTFVAFEESVEAAYSAMDIVVVPSLVPEGFGLTALEAMVYGKPVAAYASGGLREILEMAGSGHYLAECGDFADLAAKVGMLLDDPGELAQTAALNLQRVHEVFGSAAYEERIRQWLIRWSNVQPERVHLQEGEEGLICLPVVSLAQAPPAHPQSADAQPLKKSVARGKRRKGRRRKFGRHLRRASKGGGVGAGRRSGKRRRTAGVRRARRANLRRRRAKAR
ncbi:hypothetical protein J22TS3_43890 [Paenibacillus sp. J22TS3]|nr:hypothetical protein J22TS3_43890 [Paenibacillus sp. J22TS3]